MNYVTTNIRIPEEDYLRLKDEAARKRESFSAVIREKIGTKRVRSKTEVARILAKTRKLAHENAKYLKGFDGTTIIREMRNHTKW